MVLAGAGLSAASGVPTFREAQSGLWARFRPEDLATPEAFRRDPQTVWRWYQWRRELVAGVEPNAAHTALARWQSRADLTIVTQNVDGLQQRAGGRVIEFHGNIFRDLCMAENRLLAPDEQVPGVPPRCRRCGAHVRPGVVWFGEAIDERDLREATHAAQRCAVFISVGTSSLVFPAAALAGSAVQHGATLIEINPHETPLSPTADYRFEAPAEQVLPALVARVASVQT
jgi:NAD-dependent deacetylase